MLEPEPGRRYPDAASLIEDLQRLYPPAPRLGVMTETAIAVECVGRDEECRKILGWLDPVANPPSENARRATVMLGEGGMGKSRVLDSVLDDLRALGFSLVPVALTGDLPVGALSTILTAEAAAAFDDLTRTGKDDLLVRQAEQAWPNVFRQEQLIPAVEYIRANRIRTLLIRAMDEAMRGVDVLVVPTYGGDNLLATNLTGHPAVCVPNGFRESDGTPTAERPVLLAGYGITAAGARQQFRQLLDRFNIPVLVTWPVLTCESDHPLYVGRAGIYGQRGANFAIQNYDLLISIGSRLSIPQVGYNYTEFARAAKKVYVDIDLAELQKFPSAAELSVCSDAGIFLEALLEETTAYRSSEISPWRERCRQWRDQYPIALPEYQRQPDTDNSFTFIDVLSNELASDELIILGASGTAFTCTHQALKIKRGQTCFTSNGFAEMGFDLPGAIGACVAAGGKRTILVTGDGSIQMNLQELQTIIHHRLPIRSSD